ncbi:MAG TPA: TIM barrel protein [Acidobacteriaceae bacterium]|nr:TIM barrel protein [Acidobacteriaceae bacterium]
MTEFTRRTFCKTAVLCSASTVFAKEIKTPHANFPTDARARIAVATYPFRSILISPTNNDRDTSKPGMDLAAFARFIPTEFHVRGIEPLSTHFPSTERGDILNLRARFDAAGVHTVNIPVDDSVELCSSNAVTRDAGNARYRTWIDIAVTLRSPSIRIWIPKCADTSDLHRAVAALKPTIDYATSNNIVVNLENDDPVLSSEQRILAAIRLAGTPYLRALPDFANSLMGGDEQFNTQAVQHMFAHAWNIAHVKDAEVIRGKRETVSLSKLFGIAKAAGYRGYYSMESDSNVDPVIDTKHLIEESLTLI